MRKVTIPHTDLEVSHICLGTGSMGAEVGESDSFALLDAFVAAGGTFLDTAHVYGDWLPGAKHKSERTLGRWLAQTGQRDRIILATKGGHPDLGAMHISRMTPRDILIDLEESRECLGVETIDLYWLHRDDLTQPVGDIMEMLQAQVEAGTIRYFGCSNWQPERIVAAQAHATAHGFPSFVASQIWWSLAVPNLGTVQADHAMMDDAAMAFYRASDMAVVAYTSQARGFFSKASSGGIAALPEAVSRDFRNDQTEARLSRAVELATRLDTSVSAIVRAYISSQPFVAIPIIGCRTVDQLDDSLIDADLVLPSDALQYLMEG